MKIEKGHYVPKEFITSEAVHEAVFKCFVAAGMKKLDAYGNYGGDGCFTALSTDCTGVICWSCKDGEPLTLQQLFTAENGLQWPDWAGFVMCNNNSVYFSEGQAFGEFEFISGDSIGNAFVLATRQPREKEVKKEVLDKAVIQFGGLWPEFNWAESKQNKHAIVRTVKQWEDAEEGKVYRKGHIGKGGTSFDPEFCELVCTKPEFEAEAKRMGYINGYRWGVEYPTNGKRPDLVDGISVVVQVSMQSGFTGEFPMYMREDWSNVILFKITDQRHKPADTSYLNALTQPQFLTHSEEGLTHVEWWDYENDKPVSRPPLGTECLCIDQDENQTAFIVGYDFFSEDRIFWRSKKENGTIWYGGLYSFMPLDHATRKAELERKALIESAKSVLNPSELGDYQLDIIGRMIDAGWRPTK